MSIGAAENESREMRSGLRAGRMGDRTPGSEVGGEGGRTSLFGQGRGE